MLAIVGYPLGSGIESNMSGKITPRMVLDDSDISFLGIVVGCVQAFGFKGLANICRAVAGR